MPPTWLIVTTFGPSTLESFNIQTDEVTDGDPGPALNRARRTPDMSLLTVRHITTYQSFRARQLSASTA